MMSSKLNPKSILATTEQDSIVNVESPIMKAKREKAASQNDNRNSTSKVQDPPKSGTMNLQVKVDDYKTPTPAPPELIGKQGWIFRDLESQVPQTKEQFVKIWASLYENKLLFSDHNKPAQVEAINKVSSGYIELKKDTEVKIRNYEKSLINPSKNNKFCFQVKEQAGTSIIFATEDEDEREEWIDIIKQAISGITHSLPHASLIIPSPKAYLSKQQLTGIAGAPNAIVDYPKKTGYMKKTSSGNSTFGLKSVKKRFFRLDAGELRYYEDEDMRPSKLKDTLDLNDAQLITESSPTSCHIQLILHGGRVMKLEAPSATIAQEWRDAFLETFIHLKQHNQHTNKSGITDYKHKRRRFNVHDQLNEEQKEQMRNINNNNNNSKLLSRSGSFISSVPPPAPPATSPITSPPKTPSRSSSFFSRSSVTNGTTVTTPNGSSSITNNNNNNNNSSPIMETNLETQINSKPLNKFISTQTREMLKGCLSQHFLIKSLFDINEIIEALQDKIMLPGQVIIWQGTVGDEIFMLETGQCEVIKDHASIAHIYPGKTFGDLALLNNTTRQATIRACSVCKVWYLNRKVFRDVASQQQMRQMKERIEYLKQIKLFENFIESSLEAIADVMTLQTYTMNDKIIKQGDVGDCFYMIQSGRVLVTSQTTLTSNLTELCKLGPGSYFGELALLEDSPRKATVTATTNVKCWTVDRTNFLSLFGSMNEALNENIGIKMLKNVKLLETLSDKQLMTISRCLLKKKYVEGEVIIKQGDVGDSFYLVASGEVQVQVNHVNVAKLTTGSFFGEMSLLSNERRSATVLASVDSECLVLSRTDFDKLLGPLDEIIKKESMRRNEMLANANRRKSTDSMFTRFRSMSESFFSASGSPSPSKKREGSLYSSNLFELEHLDRVKKLGVGTFSTVYLIQHYMSSKYYALKVFHKENVVSMKQEENVFNERDIMLKLNESSCPFTVQIFATLQDEKSLFMVHQFIPGGDLWSLLYSNKLTQTKLGGILPNQALFYMSNVLAAISYMHDLEIVHRDLKPENMLIDQTGYLKITDFGCAKKISVGSKSNTLCGTPEYIAPEVILSKGHNKAVDYWAMGIFLYELLTRSTPFQHKNVSMTYQHIIESEEFLKGKLNEINFDINTKKAITGLLQFNPHMRLGMLRNGIDDIWSLAFFKGSSMELIEKRSMVVPYVPETESNSNHEIVEDHDILELVEDPDEIPNYTGTYDFTLFSSDS